MTDPDSDGPRPLQHLTWLCSAPGLLEDRGVLHLADWLPGDYGARIDRLASDQALLAALADAAGKRLGHYFEALYACLLTEVLGWQVLARNLPVRTAGRTLGELDFLVRNPMTGQVEHHEIAVKFYLGHPGVDGGPDLWYGPDARDRLDLKTRRLLEHQSRLAEQEATRAVLAAMGLPVPDCARVLMPGYLFYPCDGGVMAPAQVPRDHLRGRWQRASALSDVELADCVMLLKPDWLGPWHQAPAPDVARVVSAARQIAEGAPPRLFARLHQEPGTGRWREMERFFLVPDHWPAPASR